MAAKTLASHASPDGQLTLVVERLDDADILVGFLEGNGWHFHPSENEAHSIVEAVLADRVVIMETSWNDQHEVQLMGDLDFEIGSGADGVVYRFRLWTRSVTLEDLADGKVPYVPLSDLWNRRI